MLRQINVSRFLRSRAVLRLPRSLASAVLAVSAAVSLYAAVFTVLFVLLDALLSIAGGNAASESGLRLLSLLLLLPYSVLVIWRLARPGIASTVVLLGYVTLLALTAQTMTSTGDDYRRVAMAAAVAIGVLIGLEILSALLVRLRWGWHRDFRLLMKQARASLWRRAARYGILRGKTGRFVRMFAWRGFMRALIGGALFVGLAVLVFIPNKIGLKLPSAIWHNSLVDILLAAVLGMATFISIRLAIRRRQYRLLSIAFAVLWGFGFIQSADLVVSRGLSGGACQTTAFGAPCSPVVVSEGTPADGSFGDAVGAAIGRAIALMVVMAFKIVGFLAVAFVFGRTWIARPFVRGFREVRQQLVATASELAQSDPRPPILLLRSFKDDEMFTRAQQSIVLWALGALSERARIEEIVAEELFAYGPMIALSNPRDALPPLGAARESVSDDRWRDYVIENLGNSQLIVCFLGDTEHFRWEVDRIIDGGHLGKTIFVLPPTYLKERSIVKDVPVLAGALGLTDARTERRACKGGLVIGPDRDGSGFVCITGDRAQKAYAAAARLGTELALRRARAT